jgi:predicted nucleic acid-binding protein
MVECLLDASALYPLVLKLRDMLLDYLALMAVLDLTVYKVGNVICAR